MRQLIFKETQEFWSQINNNMPTLVQVMPLSGKGGTGKSPTLQQMADAALPPEERDKKDQTEAIKSIKESKKELVREMRSQFIADIGARIRGDA